MNFWPHYAYRDLPSRTLQSCPSANGISTSECLYKKVIQICARFNSTWGSTVFQYIPVYLHSTFMKYFVDSMPVNPSLTWFIRAFLNSYYQ